MTEPDDTSLWTIVMPVKSLDLAKSRLSPAATARDLALAFFQDAVEAALGSPLTGELVIATCDPVIRHWAAGRGCLVVDDAEHPGINAAAHLAATRSTTTDPVAVMVSDLPAVTSAAISAALSLASRHRTAFLADADGTGTTMWMAESGAQVRTYFGADSRAAHRAAGAVDLVDAYGEPTDVWPARRDVDTVDDLASARILGVGHHTAVALRAAT
mgnify:CR=1 FL=1